MMTKMKIDTGAVVQAAKLNQLNPEIGNVCHDTCHMRIFCLYYEHPVNRNAKRVQKVFCAMLTMV